MMKSIIFSVVLIFGGIGCFKEPETVSTGIIALSLGVIILFFKLRFFMPGDRDQEDQHSVSPMANRIQNEEYAEYMRQREKLESVERKWKKLVDRHYKLIEEIGVAYTVANNLSMPDSPQMEHVVNLCKKDIELAEGFKQYWAENRQAMIQAGYYSSSNVVADALPHYPSFKRLAIIYEKQKKYAEAIAVCQQAIDLGFSNDGTEGQMPGRIARLMRKKGKETKKLPEVEQIVIEE